MKTLPDNGGEAGSIPDLGRSHMPWSNYARAPQLLSLCSLDREPQLLKSMYLEPVLCSKRSQHNEKPVHHNQRVDPTRHNWRKSLSSNKDPAQPKINK